jgi:hypothetical protein
MRKLFAIFTAALAMIPARAFCQAQSISTNKEFVVSTALNALPPSETNFFYVNSNWMNQSVGIQITNVAGNTNQIFVFNNAVGVVLSNVWNTNAVGGGGGGGAAAPGTGIAVATNIVGSNTIYTISLSTNGGNAGFMIGQSNGAAIWTENAGGLTNLSSTQISTSSGNAGWMLSQSNGSSLWTINAGALTNLDATQLLFGIIPYGVLPSAVVTNYAVSQVNLVSNLFVQQTNFQNYEVVTNGASFGGGGVTISTSASGQINANGSIFTGGSFVGAAGGITQDTLPPQAVMVNPSPYYFLQDVPGGTEQAAWGNDGRALINIQGSNIVGPIVAQVYGTVIAQGSYWTNGVTNAGETVWTNTATTNGVWSKIGGTGGDLIIRNAQPTATTPSTNTFAVEGWGQWLQSWKSVGATWTNFVAAMSSNQFVVYGGITSTGNTNTADTSAIICRDANGGEHTVNITGPGGTYNPSTFTLTLTGGGGGSSGGGGGAYAGGNAQLANGTVKVTLGAGIDVETNNGTNIIGIYYGQNPPINTNSTWGITNVTTGFGGSFYLYSGDPTDTNLMGWMLLGTNLTAASSLSGGANTVYANNTGSTATAAFVGNPTVTNISATGDGQMSLAFENYNFAATGVFGDHHITGLTNGIQWWDDPVTTCFQTNLSTVNAASQNVYTNLWFSTNSGAMAVEVFMRLSTPTNLVAFGTAYEDKVYQLAGNSGATPTLVTPQASIVNVGNGGNVALTAIAGGFYVSITGQTTNASNEKVIITTK